MYIYWDCPKDNQLFYPIVISLYMLCTSMNAPFAHTHWQGCVCLLIQLLPVFPGMGLNSPQGRQSMEPSVSSFHSIFIYLVYFLYAKLCTHLLFSFFFFLTQFVHISFSVDIFSFPFVHFWNCCIFSWFHRWTWHILLPTAPPGACWVKACKACR